MPRPTTVASLLPAATEIVCALGARPRLVGVSHECDFPADVVGLPVLTRSKVLSRGTSAAIDRDVRRVLRDALAVYDLELERLARLAPDVIVTQDLCDVCAVSLDDVRRAAAELLPSASIVSLRPTRLEDVWRDVRTVAEALGVPGDGERVAEELRGRVAALGARAGALDARPAVLTVEWLDPVMVGGTWMPELVELAGGRALVTRPGQHAPTLDADALRALDPAPEVVLVKPCGFDLPRALSELDALRPHLARCDWPALREGRVFAADGNAFFNRPGPRLVESLEILAACLHPAAFAAEARRHAASFRRVDLAATA